MVQAELTPLSGIVEHLRGLCDQRRTGTVFLVSDENRMAQIHLDRGDIVSIIHRNKRGLDALAVLVTMKSARLRFDDSYVTTAEKHDILTNDIFGFLDGSKPMVGASSTPPGPSGSSKLSAEIKAAMQRILTTYVGPMAEIVCVDHFERVTDPRELVKLLASEISDKEQAAAFSKAAFDYLGGAPSKTAAPGRASDPSNPVVLSAETRATVLRIMTQYVGPIAEIVCADYFERATDLRTLAQSLVDEVPDQQQAAKFAVEIGKALNLKPG